MPFWVLQAREETPGLSLPSDRDNQEPERNAKAGNCAGIRRETKEGHLAAQEPTPPVVKSLLGACPGPVLLFLP